MEFVTKDIEEIMYEVLTTIAEEDEYDGIDQNCNIRTFEEAGLLTNDCGLVIDMPGGGQFQLTIVRSR